MLPKPESYVKDKSGAADAFIQAHREGADHPYSAKVDDAAGPLRAMVQKQEGNQVRQKRGCIRTGGS